MSRREFVEPRLLNLLQASAVEIDRPRWVWEGRIPVGGTTLMAGKEGLGKTALVNHLAARLTRGDLAGEWFGCPADVVYIGYEDDRSTVLLPRLVAADADLDRFHFVDIPNGGSFSVDVDTDRLEDELRAEGLDVALVIVDPLDSHLGSGVDTHRKAEVQSSIQRLAELAQELRCGAIGLAHLNKGDVKELLARVVGSVGFTTATRSVLAVGEHPDNPSERVCVLAKANMVDRSTVPAVHFRVERVDLPHPDGGEPIGTAGVVIMGEVEGIEPDSILRRAADETDRSAVEEAADILRRLLADGPVEAEEAMKTALAVSGHSEKTIRRAKSALGVKSRKRGLHGGWEWCLEGGPEAEGGPKAVRPGPDHLEDHLRPDDDVLARSVISTPTPSDVPIDGRALEVGPCIACGLSCSWLSFGRLLHANCPDPDGWSDGGYQALLPTTRGAGS